MGPSDNRYFGNNRRQLCSVFTLSRRNPYRLTRRIWLGNFCGVNISVGSHWTDLERHNCYRCCHGRCHRSVNQPRSPICGHRVSLWLKWVIGCLHQLYHTVPWRVSFTYKPKLSADIDRMMVSDSPEALKLKYPPKPELPSPTPQLQKLVFLHLRFPLF